jgi:hypothetical protein
MNRFDLEARREMGTVLTCLESHQTQPQSFFKKMMDDPRNFLESGSDLMLEDIVTNLVAEEKAANRFKSDLSFQDQFRNGAIETAAIATDPLRLGLGSGRSVKAALSVKKYPNGEPVQASAGTATTVSQKDSVPTADGHAELRSALLNLAKAVDNVLDKMDTK